MSKKWKVALIIIFIACMNADCRKQKHLEDLESGRNLQTSQFLSFEEDLHIKRDDWTPMALEVDPEENIYVFNEMPPTVYIFDKSGKEIARKEFKEGQGPGDFHFMDPCFGPDGRLFIFDKSSQRLTIFDRNWKILDSRCIKPRRGDFMSFRADSRGDMYYWKNDTNYTDKGKISTMSLYKMPSSGGFCGEIRIYAYHLTDTNPEKGTITYYIYPPSGIFKIGPDDRIYFAMSDVYSIDILSPQGKLIRNIVRPNETRKTTERDLDRYKTATRTLSRYGRLEYAVPDHMPAIADLFVFENNQLLVVTYKNAIDSSYLHGDLFDAKGKYLAEVNVPKYYHWGHWSVIFKKPAISKNDKFYIFADEGEDENIVLKRFKMNWK